MLTSAKLKRLLPSCHPRIDVANLATARQTLHPGPDCLGEWPGHAQTPASWLRLASIALYSASSSPGSFVLRPWLQPQHPFTARLRPCMHPLPVHARTRCSPRPSHAGPSRSPAASSSRFPRLSTEHAAASQGQGGGRGLNLAVIMQGKSKPCWVPSNINVSKHRTERFQIPSSDVISNNVIYFQGATNFADGPFIATPFPAMIWFPLSLEKKKKDVGKHK